MAKTPLISADTRQLLQNGFFANLAHQFKEVDQTEWIDFACSAANQILDYFRINSGNLTLYDTLTFIGELRFNFAEAQQDKSLAGNNDFGKWRTEAAGLNFHTLVKEIQSGHKQTQESSFDVQIFRDFYGKANGFFEVIDTNLKSSIASDRDAISIHYPDKLETGFILDILRQNKKFKVSPDSFYDIATFVNYAFIGRDEENTEYRLTSYYCTNNLEPHFFVSDHPQPEDCNRLLKGRLNLLFLESIAPEIPLQSRLASAAELIWYCHQLMPFQRGTASILLILTAALLIQNQCKVIPYQGIRLDIDALSLSKKLFTEKFMAGYA